MPKDRRAKFHVWNLYQYSFVARNPPMKNQIETVGLRFLLGQVNSTNAEDFQKQLLTFLAQNLIP